MPLCSSYRPLIGERPRTVRRRRTLQGRAARDGRSCGGGRRSGGCTRHPGDTEDTTGQREGKAPPLTEQPTSSLSSTTPRRRGTALRSGRERERRRTRTTAEGPGSPLVRGVRAASLRGRLHPPSCHWTTIVIARHGRRDCVALCGARRRRPSARARRQSAMRGAVRASPASPSLHCGAPPSRTRHSSSALSRGCPPGTLAARAASRLTAALCSAPVTGYVAEAEHEGRCVLRRVLRRLTGSAAQQQQPVAVLMEHVLLTIGPAAWGQRVDGRAQA